MLSVQQIYELAYLDELKRNSEKPVYIWVTGQFAAGKTFFIEHLSKELMKLAACRRKGGFGQICVRNMSFYR